MAAEPKPAARPSHAGEAWEGFAKTLAGPKSARSGLGAAESNARPEGPLRCAPAVSRGVQARGRVSPEWKEGY